MGVDYYAQTYLGIWVTKDMFVTTEMQTKVVCDHPEAEGQKFCPVCGTAEGNRTKEREVEVWRPETVKTIEAICHGWGISATELNGGWNGLWEDGEWRIRVKHPVELWRVQADDPELLFGVRLAEAGGWGDPDIVSLSATRVAEQAEQVQQLAAELGIEGDVQLVTVRHAS